MIVTLDFRPEEGRSKENRGVNAGANVRQKSEEGRSADEEKIEGGQDRKSLIRRVGTGDISRPDPTERFPIESL